MKIGLMGGVFDPPHKGHILTASFLLKNGTVDKIIVVPSFVQPLKPNVITPYNIRMEMAKVAFNKDERVVVSDVESRIDTPSYTINTVAELRKEYSDEMFVIIGYDQAEDILRWHRYEELCRSVKFIIVRRDHKEHFIDGVLFKSAILLENPVFEISSTQIRDMIKNRNEAGSFLTDEVIKIINREKLYIER